MKMMTITNVFRMLQYLELPLDAMIISGDKVRARKVALRVAPVVDGAEVSNESDATKEAERIGYPIILKAVEGGGGRGLRIVKSHQELANAYLSSRNESMVGFGSERVYIEKYIENPRHIEVQIIADDTKIVHLGERECSIQRRYQKLIEETPSPALSTEKRNEISQTAIEVMNEIGYRNAGTVEFLFKDNRFYFMEVNARIQVEHPITEAVTGIDIVEQQLLVASGKGLSVNQQNIDPKGHAIECRINAEHPLNFIPFPGEVKNFVMPNGDGIRVDTALYAGYSIPTFYDSLIAKLICWGNNRHGAIEKMKDSLLSFRISGIPSTIPFHISALNDTRFIGGYYDTSFIDKMSSFSARDGDIAAAVFSLLPKRIKFLRSKEEEEEQQQQQDPWLNSRFDWIDVFDIYHIIIPIVLNYPIRYCNETRNQWGKL
jgi:acetyl-CoA carboxylase, biotin carboxylase subunit